MYRVFSFIINYIFVLSGLIVLTPLIFIICIAIYLDDINSSIIFKQTRVGKNEKPFIFYKFRTMRPNKEKSFLTLKKDSRITKVGKILRKYKLDEIPQLVNVLKGDLNLIGPRPETFNYLQYYKDRKTIFSNKPGLTDLYTNKYYDESLHFENFSESVYINEVIPIKNDYFINYINNKNILLDIKIIILTISNIFFRKKN